MSDTRNRLDKGVNPKVILPTPPAQSTMPDDYAPFLEKLQQQISQERLRAQLSANAVQIMLYWDLGAAILQKQSASGWGAKVIDRLSADLKEAFPTMKGFSARNLKYMRKFAQEWPDREIVQRCVAQIPWRSNIVLMEKVKEPQLRLWYASQAIENGWSKDILGLQVESKLHTRLGESANNFDNALPPVDSDMARYIFKDPYIFDFLGTTEVRLESELEEKLVRHIEKFLLELGQGFAFVGRQVPVEVGESFFKIDLLFYHLRLRCYVVIELKAGSFQPSYLGQLNMYMSIVDDVMRHEDDKPTIGLLLVRDKDHTVAKYSLAGYKNPIGVAEWEQKISESIPEDLKPSLPTIEEIEAELDGSDA